MIISSISSVKEGWSTQVYVITIPEEKAQAMVLEKQPLLHNNLERVIKYRPIYFKMSTVCTLMSKQQLK